MRTNKLHTPGAGTTPTKQQAHSRRTAWPPQGACSKKHDAAKGPLHGTTQRGKETTKAHARRGQHRTKTHSRRRHAHSRRNNGTHAQQSNRCPGDTKRHLQHTPYTVYVIMSRPEPIFRDKHHWWCRGWWWAKSRLYALSQNGIPPIFGCLKS